MKPNGTALYCLSCFIVYTLSYINLIYILAGNLSQFQRAADTNPNVCVFIWNGIYPVKKLSRARPEPQDHQNTYSPT